MSLKIQSPLHFKSVIQLLEYFDSEVKCLKYLEQIVWEDGNPVCPHCKCEKAYRFKDEKRFKCSGCRKQFTAKIGTIFQDSKLSLRKWYVALFYLSAHKKGMSARQLARDINVTVNTAWFMMHRLREGMLPLEDVIDGVVQLDETFVGGKNKNRHKNKKVSNTQGRSFKDKTPVMGMLTNDGSLICKVITDTSPESLHTPIYDHIVPGTILVTDEWSGYNGIEMWFDRQIVDHGKRLYVNDCGFTTNHLEGAWSHLKRSIIGVYHNVSKKYLQRYANEFSFRFSTRLMNDCDRFNLLMSKINRPLKYKQLVYGEVA